MNLLKRMFKTIILAGLIAVFIVSCSKDDNDLPEEKSYEYVTSINTETAQALFATIGQVVSSNDALYNVDVYKYQYKTNFRNKEIVASGLICVPVSEGSIFPVLSFQHGTMVAHNEAPSVGYNNILNKSVEVVSCLGYVVVMPDLIGFGSSNNYLHPYMVKQHQISAVTDMLNSIRDIPPGELSGSGINDSLFLMGYSQGGWSTMAILNYLDEVDNDGWDVIATACGAGPYSLETVKEFALEGKEYPQPYYMAYVFNAFVDEGLIDNDFSRYYKEPYASKVSTVFNGTNLGSTINSELTTVNADLYSSALISDYPNGKYAELKQALEANSVNAWKTDANILILHGSNDIYIPISVSDSMYNNFTKFGAANIQYQVIPLGDHITAAIPAMVNSIQWFEDFRYGSLK